MSGETQSFPCYMLFMLKPTERTRAAARRSRREPTMAEVAVWKMLRDRRLGDWKFRRQMPVGPYIADFCCPALKLIIELDGGVHVLRAESDAKRDGWLTAKAGFTVLRFANEVVLRNPAVVFEAVRLHAARQT
ncbi:MAG: hypothetical protein RJA14_1409 [Pseudomonadota bacterium]